MRELLVGGVPRWDKPLWDDTGSWFKAPNLRTIGAIASGIAATVLTGGIGGIAGIAAAAAISTTSTVLFDALDVAGGYKSWEEAGLDIGKTFLTSAATSTIGGVFNGFGAAANGATSTFWNTGIAGALGDFGKGVVGKTLLAGTQAFTTNVATSAISAVSWSKDGGLGWNTDAFTSGAFGTGAIASSIGAAAGSFTTTSLTKSLSVADNKFYSGAVSLAGGAATELARYGTYVGYEYGSGRGGNLSDIMTRAYGNMGGLTLNVANAGAILDMLGTGVAMNSEGGQSDLGKYAQMLSGSGLMELNFGPRGITGRLGTGGTDVGGGMYRLAKGMADKALLEDYQRADSQRGAIAMNAYVYGDWTAENTARRLGEGKDQLTFGFEGAKGKIDENTKGYTQTNGKGGRTIFLKDGGTAPGSLLNQAIMLQHEAYRNGVADADNGLETYRAVTAHTIMAAQFDERLLDSELRNDVEAYKKGDAAFKQYVGETYDSSGDYWRVLKSGAIFDDGKDGVISFEDGRETIRTKNKTKQGSLEEFLKTATPGGLSGTLDRAGFKYENGKGWTSAGGTISAETIQALVERGIISPEFNSPSVANRMKMAEEQKRAEAERERKAWEQTNSEMFSKFNKDNPQVRELLKQYDKALKDRPNIATGGCVARDIEAVCEIAAGKTLRDQQIISIWDKAIEEKIILSTGFVMDPSGLADLTLNRLGAKGFGVEVDSNSHNGKLVGYIGRMPYNGKDTHKAFYLSTLDSGKPFFNSGTTNNAVSKWSPVYIFPKK